MKISYIQRMFSAFVCVLLSGCMSNVARQKPPVFLEAAPIQLPVRSVQLLWKESECISLPFERTQFKHMVHQWADTQIQATGGSDQLRLIIEQARIEQQVERPDTSSWFIPAVLHDYKATLCVVFERLNGIGGVKKTRITVTADKTIPREYTIAQRQKALVSLYEEVLNRLTNEVQNVLLK
jgi:hypothetical protein